MADLIFGGVSLAENSAFFDGSKAFIKPQKDVEFISVAGRNGDLSFTNNRYMNVEIHFNCFIRNDFIENYSSIINQMSLLEGYQRLEYTTEPDIYRMAQFVSATEPETGAWNDSAQFELVFNCKPQKFLTGYDDWILFNSGGTIQNPSWQTAYPIFQVRGNGQLNILNGTSGLPLTQVIVQGLGSNDYTEIDSETQDAYHTTTNRNQNVTVTNGFPVIDKDGIRVQVTNFSIVAYIPRFWRL